MASLIFQSCLLDMARGLIEFDTDDFKVMLTTPDYQENKDRHSRRSDVTNEVNGQGYSAGGSSVDVKVAKDTKGIEITLGGADWSQATISARKAVYYKSRGKPLEDSLIAVIDFGKDVVSTNGTFALTASILRIQN